MIIYVLDTIIISTLHPGYGSFYLQGQELYHISTNTNMAPAHIGLVETLEHSLGKPCLCQNGSESSACGLTSRIAQKETLPERL